MKHRLVLLSVVAAVLLLAALPSTALAGREGPHQGAGLPCWASGGASHSGVAVPSVSATAGPRAGAAIPAITRLSPATANRGGKVTITGRGFGSRRGRSHVTFGSTRCAAYVSWKAGLIVCRVPKTAARGKITVRVRTSRGTSNGTRLWVVAQPKPPRSTGWAAVSCGRSHTLAVKKDGTLWAWGDNYSGDLGLGDTKARRTPTRVGSATDWAAVSCGDTSTLALRTDGTLWAWGDNEFSELGLGDTMERRTPTRVGSATDWAAVSCGLGNTLALKTDGTLWAWGVNFDGQLGLGDTATRDAPAQVGSATDWAAVSCGYDSHTLALKKDGTLWAWGFNDFGQLGLGDISERHSPTQVGSATDWAAVSCGADWSTLALKKDGTLWAWGFNSAGVLGLGDTTERHSPTEVGSAANWAAVSAGGNQALALRKDGTLWAWGYNSVGQLGLGDTRERHSPTQVGSATDWAAVSSGDAYNVALKTDGTFRAWGYDGYGGGD